MDVNAPPDHPLWSRVITVEMTVYEAHMARAAARHQHRKRQRDIDRRGPFTPEPGRLDTAQLRVNALRSVEQKLGHAVNEARKEARP